MLLWLHVAQLEYNMDSKLSGQQDYHVGGVPVKFPCKPYSTQMAMMAKIIQALSHKHNALLESPTGSGKSLALLCSVLAWQKQEYLKLEQEDMKDSKHVPGNKQDVSMTCTCDCHDNKGSSSSLPSSSNSAPTGASNIPPHVPPWESGRRMPSGLSTTHNQPSSSTKNASTPIEQLDGTTRPVDNAGQAVGGSNDVIELDGTTRQTHNSESAGNSSDSHTSEKNDPASTSSVPLHQDATNPVTTTTNGTGSVDVKCADKEDDDDGDFKVSNKRFRTPSSMAENTTKRRKVKKKGVCYEDASVVNGDNEMSTLPPPTDSNGQPKWKMEFPGGLVPGVGIPQSQIMDSDFQDNKPRGPYFVPKPQATPTTCTCPKCGCGPNEKMESAKMDNAAKRGKAPKIYFGTRTHKQITQITHEMARTAYSGTPMCILASREHTCIHPEVSKCKNKNEECKKLLDYADGVSCAFHHNVQKKLGTQAQLRQHGFYTAWDIEDLVTLGKRIRTCPYFVTRGLVEEADIVFCPYNYLIDPIIRDQMSVEIENTIIILDEAHNMEDSAREAASLSVSNVHLQEISKEIIHLVTDPRLGELKHHYMQLQAFCSAVLRWIEHTSDILPARGYEQAYGIWNGKDFLPIMEQQLGITHHTLQMYRAHHRAIVEANSDKEQRETLPSISVNSLNTFEKVFRVMGYLFKDNCHFLPDYRMSLMKSMVTVSRTEPGTWMSKKRRSRAQEKVWTFTLNFWCLNPAVAFSEMSRARSIILTSGTLSPMSSFSSELGVSFPIQLEANHVIPESQTWVSSISHGPHGKSLIANYQNTETFDFQDELGEAVLKVCQTVPYGVLCFFSSYKMLEKLTNRWQDTGLWFKILREKFIVSEPRSGRKEDFEVAMSSFYNVVEESSVSRTTASGEECQTGALFLAVCRGKVSEGLDFANNNARAVITVGIPFPSIKDKQVELKREYNNEHFHSRGLLTGSEWYEIQAYRALNQALGRCIRHKKDWGALILIDERYSKGPHYTKGLSKWVRQRIKHEKDFSQAITSLRSFTEMRMKTDSSEANTTGGSSLFVLDKSSPSLAVSMSSPQLPHHSLSITSTPHRDVTSPTFPYPGSISTPSTTHSPSTAGVLTSTPVNSKPTGKITDFLNSTGICKTKFGNPGSLTPVNSSRNEETVSSTSVRSRFHYPSKATMVPNETITLSQIQNLAPGLPLADKDESMSVPDDPNTAKTTSSSDQVFSPKAPTVIVLEDSLEEASGSILSHTIQTPEVNESKDEEMAVDENKPVDKIVCESPLLGELREESPILFETPSTIGGNHQSLASKLAKRTLTVDKSYSSPTKIDTNQPDDVDATPPMSQRKQRTPQSATVQKLLDSAKSSCKTRQTRSSRRASTVELSSPLGQPKVRRANTRLTSKKTAEMNSSKQQLLSSFCSVSKKVNSEDVDTDDVDFRPAKTLQEKKLSAQGDVVSCRGCGHQLSEHSDSIKEIELKQMLADCHLPKVVSSSKLWQHLKGTAKPRRKKLNILLLFTSHVKCLSRDGNDGYNAVWDDKLGLCYTLLLCQCDCIVGASIHATNGGSQALIGKSILTVDQVVFSSLSQSD